MNSHVLIPNLNFLAWLQPPTCLRSWLAVQIYDRNLENCVQKQQSICRCDRFDEFLTEIYAVKTAIEN